MTTTTPQLPIRQPKWATKLNSHLLSLVGTPFAWGTHDCSLMAADAIKAITGVDIASRFRGKYNDQKSAMAAIKSVTGGSTVADAAAYCAARHGLQEWVYPLFAQRGDLVVFNNGDQVIAGIVHLSGKHLVSVSESGLVKAPISTISRAWRIPVAAGERMPAGRLKPAVAPTAATATTATPAPTPAAKAVTNG